ncbi:hypothetical protein [Phytohabitans kaempferiae]|uniref:4,5-dihydroxyphthalate decarboxylase n=1 Tax=Phytohabitans kaempferiae TaxID=1620943 RepID=A0ABV6LZH8_9ACTN
MTGRLRLSLAVTANPWVAPIASGEVTAEGIELLVTRSDPSELFWRQLRLGEFDASEMSLSSFLIARERGVEMVGLPVFPGRRFMHTELYANAAAKIDGPGALAGKRVGVPEYQQTSALWTRGILQHDFGVAPESVEWFMERPAERSHGGATGFTVPPGIRLRQVPPGRSLDSMLLAGELDAAPAGRARYHLPNAVDPDEPAAGWDGLRPLFDDVLAEAGRYVAAHGFVPANNLVVIRGDVYDRHPWVAYNLYEAFRRAKALAAGALTRTVAGGLPLGRQFLRQQDAMLGPDPAPYGLPENRDMLHELCRFSREQGLTTAPIDIDDLFAASVR